MRVRTLTRLGQWAPHRQQTAQGRLFSTLPLPLLARQRPPPFRARTTFDDSEASGEDDDWGTRTPPLQAAAPAAPPPPPPPVEAVIDRIRARLARAAAVPVEPSPEGDWALSASAPAGLYGSLSATETMPGAPTRGQALASRPEGRPAEAVPRVAVALPPVVLPAAEAALSRREQAYDWVESAFGSGWTRLFHPTHRLSVAEPLVYCVVCGRCAGDRQHLQALAGHCYGPPGVGSTYLARLRWVGQGRHPINPAVQLRLPPVPVLRGRALPSTP